MGGEEVGRRSCAAMRHSLELSKSEVAKLDEGLHADFGGRGEGALVRSL
jgi:hypothetical protein